MYTAAIDCKNDCEVFWGKYLEIFGVTHLDNATYPSDLDQVKRVLTEQKVDFAIPQIGEVILLS